MNLIHKINFDNEGIYDETYFCDGQEITAEQYYNLEADLKDSQQHYEDVDFECGTEECCVECDCTDCEPQKSKNIIINVNVNESDIENIANHIKEIIKRQIDNIGVFGY